MRTSTKLPGYDGKAACIADKARLKYFKYPDGRYIMHCDCWTPNLQPARGTSVREDWIEVNLWEPKLVREVVVQGCTDFEKQWVAAFKVQYTYDGLVWHWLGHRNKGTEFKGAHRGSSVVRTPVDIPFKARKVRVYPTRCIAEDGVVPTCAMRFEVFMQEVPT